MTRRNMVTAAFTRVLGSTNSCAYCDNCCSCLNLGAACHLYHQRRLLQRQRLVVQNSPQVRVCLGFPLLLRKLSEINVTAEDRSVIRSHS